MKQHVKLKCLYTSMRNTQEELNVNMYQKWLMGIAETLGDKLQHWNRETCGSGRAGGMMLNMNSVCISKAWES